MVTQSLIDAIVSPLNQVWNEFVALLPAAVGALVAFIVGIFVSAILGSAVEKGLRSVKVDTVLENTEFDKDLKRAGINTTVSRFLGRLVYWFFLIATLVLVIGILFGSPASAFAIIQPILSYIPQVVVAVIILLGAIILANFLRGVIKTAAAGAKVHSTKFLGAIAWWSVLVFGVIAALTQLEIASQFLYAIFVALIGMLALAGGLAFGLGGREFAASLLEKFREQVEEK
ncbi:MAG TPA: hypothetical protein VMU70_01750 [Candidatus Tyrphobacter sp.]|nr:hypothetical protein [Candidatus Tyrphobacter sp.]